MSAPAIVSVAVCTWNRAAQLDKLLTSMRDLQWPAARRWELLIVNNNCTDATDTVIRRHMPALPIVHLREPRQGISHARNTAVRHARGEHIIWTDDDVRVDPAWLQAYVDAFEAYPQAAAFGGPIRPRFEAEPPEWLAHNLDRLGTYYALRDFGSERRVLQPEKNYPYGANMAFRTRILQQKPFDPALGRNGNILIGGEETRIMTDLWRAGEDIVWVPDASVTHHIAADRMRLRYLRQIQYCQGRYGNGREDVYRRKPIMHMARRWLAPALRYRIRRLARQPAACWLPDMLRASRWRGRLAARWRQ